MDFWIKKGSKIYNCYESLTIKEFRDRFNDESTTLDTLLNNVNQVYSWLNNVPKPARRLAYSLLERREHI